MISSTLNTRDKKYTFRFIMKVRFLYLHYWFSLQYHVHLIGKTRSRETQAGDRSNSVEGKHLPRSIQLESVDCFCGVSITICLSNQVAQCSYLSVILIVKLFYCWRSYDYCDWYLFYVSKKVNSNIKEHDLKWVVVIYMSLCCCKDLYPSQIAFLEE